MYTTLRRRRAPVNRTGGGAGRGLPPIPTSLVAADSYIAESPFRRLLYEVGRRGQRNQAGKHNNNAVAP